MRSIKFLTLFIVSFPLMLNAQMPEREWLSYYGGALTTVSDIIYEPNCDCIYMVGLTADSTGIATVGSHKESIGSLTAPTPIDFFINTWDTDIFLAKFDLEGNRLWSTYFGGPKAETTPVLNADDEGNIFISGFTFSNTGVSTMGSLYEVKYSPETVKVPYIAKFDDEGELQWSTYYDVYNDLDSNTYTNSEVATDSFGNVYISGVTYSDTGIATLGSYLPTKGTSAGSSYIGKLDNDGNLLWGTYFYGSDDDDSHYTGISNINIGKDGFLYVTGTTKSYSGIATAGVYQPVNLSPDLLGYGSGFLAKFDPSSGARVWGTYIGSDTGTVLPYFVSADAKGEVYVYGRTTSPYDIATAGTHREVKINLPGHMDLFIMKFDSTGNKLWGTYYGGPGYNDISSQATIRGTSHKISNLELSNDDGYFYVCGGTPSDTAIANECGYETTSPYKRGFFSKFNAEGQMVFGSYFDEYVQQLSLKPQENKALGRNDIFIVAMTDIEGIATPGSFKDSFSGLGAGYFGKFVERCTIEDFNISYASPVLSGDVGYTEYDWYHNGILVHSDSVNEWGISDSTGYYYCIAKKCGCEYMSNTIIFTTGINEMNLKDVVDIYPNPAEDEIFIEIKDLALTNMVVGVIDIAGRNILNKAIKDGERKIRIDIRELPKGVYLINLKSDEGVRHSKFVKR